MILASIDGLFFAALYQPLGSVMQPAEQQATVIAAYLCGELAFPNVHTMRQEMMGLQEATDKRFIKAAAIRWRLTSCPSCVR